MTSAGFARWGGLTAIGFAAAAIVGLGLWLTGADMPEPQHSTADLAERVVSIDRAIAGAWVLILTMVILAGFSWWLMARYGHRSALVAVGAGQLALAATIHLMENLLVIGLYDGIIRPMAASGGSDSPGDALWSVASSASVLAFGVLGLGALMAGMGFLSQLGRTTMVRLLGRVHRGARIRCRIVRDLRWPELPGRTIQPEPARLAHRARPSCGAQLCSATPER